MSEYTPDEEQVREQYTQEQPPQIGSAAEKSAEFDRFLAKIKADALRDVADWLEAVGRPGHPKPPSIAPSALRYKADRIEGYET